MDNFIIAFRRIFNPDQKCDACRLVTPEPLFLLFFKDGTKKCVHGGCK